MADINDMDIDNLFEPEVEEVNVDEEELSKAREMKRQALRNKIRAKRSLRNPKCYDPSNKDEVASMLDTPEMNNIMSKLMKDNNLNILMNSLQNKNSAKSLSKMLNQ
mgnify:CR=1 FL=1